MSLTNSVIDIIPIIRGFINDKSRTDGRDSYINKTSNIFTLTEDFIDSSTITVFVNTNQITSFTFDADNNQITITSALTLDDTVLIKYNYFKKYSDTEIQGFLESSLAYFPMYQYKKTFEINDTNEIVAINGLDPTTEELYIIAQIASILIDPQNVRIAIPDLNMSAKRDKSDQEQIKEIFIHFKDFVGVIDFEAIKRLLD